MARSLLFFVAVVIGLKVDASAPLVARVLVDETSLTQTLRGEVYIQCLAPTVQLCKKSRYYLKPGRWQITAAQDSIKIKNLDKSMMYQLNGRHFKFYGSFFFQEQVVKHLELHHSGSIKQWVLHLPVQRYLQGVLASEVPASWPIEALKAQAIASRTYFLFKKQERVKDHFDVRSSTMDQVFNLDSDKHQSIIKAVHQTKGEILVSKKQKQIFPAYFHSDCGGSTSNEAHVWRKPAAYNRSVSDPVCASVSKNNWSFGIAKKKLKSLLHKVLFLPHGAELKDILPRNHNEGRSHFVDFIFSNNILKRLSANDLRKLLGFGKLKSTRFQVTQHWDKVIFSGRGFGHGVGMCQWGAKRWAQKGQDYRSILRHYYPAAVISGGVKSEPKSHQAQLRF